MSEALQEQTQETQKQNSKEYNFDLLRQQVEKERLARTVAEEKLAQMEQRSVKHDEDDDASDEPYVDTKRLNKKLANFEKTMDQKIEQKAEAKARAMLEEERKNNYLRDHTDFNTVLSHDNIQRFAEAHPELVEEISQIKDEFSKQKFVYKNIKALQMDRVLPKEPSIQEKIDSNRRSPYYQPSNGPGAAPYASQGDFSATGQKNAFQKMKELQARLR